MPVIPKTKIQSTSDTIVELEGLRGITSIWVLLGHWATTIEQSISPLKQDFWSVQAVDVFIILSGFVITLLLHGKKEHYGTYIIRRFFRIVPVYWVVLIISAWFLPFLATEIGQGPESTMKASRLGIVADTYRHYWPSLGMHFMLLHGLMPNSYAQYGVYHFVGQAWSISLEWQFYLCAPLFLLLIQNIKKPSAVIALVAMVAGLFFTRSYFSPAYLGAKLYLLAIGSLSCVLWERQANGAHVLQLSQLRLGCLAILMICAFFHRINFLAAALWTCVLYLILASQLANAKLEHIACFLLNNRVCRFLGRISYSVYLVHFQIMFLCVWALASLGLSPFMFSALLLVGTVVISVGIATLLNILIEKPMMGYGRRLAVHSVQKNYFGRFRNNT